MEPIDFIDYITGPERPPMTKRWLEEERHRHASLDETHWTLRPLTRHVGQEHGVHVGYRETLPGLHERHVKMHPEGEDTNTGIV